MLPSRDPRRGERPRRTTLSLPLDSLSWSSLADMFANKQVQGLDLSE